MHTQQSIHSRVRVGQCVVSIFCCMLGTDAVSSSAAAACGQAVMVYCGKTMGGTPRYIVRLPTLTKVRRERFATLVERRLGSIPNQQLHVSRCVANRRSTCLMRIFQLSSPLTHSSPHSATVVHQATTPLHRADAPPQTALSWWLALGTFPTLRSTLQRVSHLCSISPRCVHEK